MTAGSAGVRNMYEVAPPTPRMRMASLGVTGNTSRRSRPAPPAARTSEFEISTFARFPATVVHVIVTLSPLL